tara:strand:+ start:82 stop:852 length:771 start_codon:yes stop_codon:yes gene_type:complete
MSGKGGTNTGGNKNVPPSLRGETGTQKKIRIDNATNKAALGADAYARNELGIVEVKGGFQDRNVVGYKSTQQNQRYGADYNQKRGEYLSQLGLAVGREATDAMGNKRTVYDPRNSDGVYTNISRNAMSQATDMGTPLSKEMYASQQNTKLAFGALGTLMSGMPMFFSLAYMSSKKPYAEAVSNFYTKGQTKRTSTQTNNRNDSVNIASSEGQQSSYSQTTAKTKTKNMKARTAAGSGEESKRRMLATNQSLIKGDM